MPPAVSVALLVGSICRFFVSGGTMSSSPISRFVLRITIRYRISHASRAHLSLVYDTACVLFRNALGCWYWHTEHTANDTSYSSSSSMIVAVRFCCCCCCRCRIYVAKMPRINTYWYHHTRIVLLLSVVVVSTIERIR